MDRCVYEQSTMDLTLCVGSCVSDTSGVMDNTPNIPTNPNQYFPQNIAFTFLLPHQYLKNMASCVSDTSGVMDNTPNILTNPNQYSPQNIAFTLKNI